jgi:hypothetical protein
MTTDDPLEAWVRLAAAHGVTVTTTDPRPLPSEREVARWDREHRRACQEASCTLPHRMLAFADWYIVIAREVERQLDAQRALSADLRANLMVARFSHAETLTSAAAERARHAALVAAARECLEALRLFRVHPTSDARDRVMLAEAALDRAALDGEPR